jgi:hypothetical protein
MKTSVRNQWKNYALCMGRTEPVLVFGICACCLLLLATFPLNMILSTKGQLKSKNIKWKSPEIHSS